MGLIFKIAFRNLFRHKARSFAIGFVILIGVFFMMVGMGTIRGMEKGIKQNVIRGLVGEVALVTADRRDDNLGGSFEPLNPIENYETIKKTLADQDYVDHFLFQIYAYAAMLDLSMGSSDYRQPDVIVLWGIDPEKQQQMYGDNFVILEGAPLKPGEKGMLINVRQRERLFNLHDVWLVPENSPVAKENLTDEALAMGDRLFTRSDLVLMGMSGGFTATDVRVPIKGIFKYRHLNDLTWATNIIDIETSREVMGYISGDDMKTDLSEAQKEMLRAVDENPEALFSGDAMVQPPEPNPRDYDFEEMLKRGQKKSKPGVTDSGVYNVAQINLKPGMALNEGVRKLFRTFETEKISGDVRAVPWEAAFPGIKNTIATFRIALMVFVGIIYLAAVLMITNSLTMAASERTGEIGTMRMVGAQKKTIAEMFIAETALLSFLFGGLGILLGAGAVKMLAAAQITSKNNLLLFLFGGDVFSPLLDINGIISGIAQLVIITIMAMAYPVVVARRIQPMDAVKGS